MMKIYRLPSVPGNVPAEVDDEENEDGSPPNGIFQGLPPNEPLHILVRVYVVKVSQMVRENQQLSSSRRENL